MATGGDTGDRAGVLITGWLFYGADDDKHGAEGVCGYLTPMIAVQGKLKFVANFLIPATQYKTGWLNGATGQARVTMASNARSEIEKRSDWAGDLSVGTDSLGVGISHSSAKKITLFTDRPRSTTLRLSSKVAAGQPNPCRNAGKETIGGQAMVRVECTWETGLTAISYTATDQRTHGGLRTIKVDFSAKLASAQHSYTLIFSDDGDG